MPAPTARWARHTGHRPPRCATPPSEASPLSHQSGPPNRVQGTALAVLLAPQRVHTQRPRRATPPAHVSPLRRPNTAHWAQSSALPVGSSSTCSGRKLPLTHSSLLSSSTQLCCLRTESVSTHDSDETIASSAQLANAQSAMQRVSSRDRT